MTVRQSNDPLHGVTLEMMLRQMVEQFGWEGLARDIPIRCFLVEPSLPSALKYLRKAPRTRQKVEQVYLRNGDRAQGLSDPARASGPRAWSAATPGHRNLAAGARVSAFVPMGHARGARSVTMRA